MTADNAADDSPELSSVVSGLFQQAVLAHSQCRLADAEQLYRAVLQQAPRHAEAHHWLGMIAFQAGYAAKADQRLAVSLELQPNNAVALNNRGNILMALSRPAEALTCFDQALAIDPNNLDVINNRGNPLLVLNKLEDALAGFDRILAIDAAHVSALSNRGYTLNRLKRPDDALISLDRALAIQPSHADALNNRGNALLALKRLDEALAAYDQALAARPESVEILNNRGHVLIDLLRPEEALKSLDRALALQPQYVDAIFNRGNALVLLSRMDEALDAFTLALRLRPDHAATFFNRANVLTALHRIGEALESFDRAQALEPDHAEYQWNDSLCRLLAGDYEAGLAQYEWRWRTKAQSFASRNFKAPLWLGVEDLRGKTILLHAEQGYGDTLQFCRYAPLVARRGARVLLEVQWPLKKLLSSLDGVAEIYARGEPLPDFDFQCPLLSLPLAFGTTLHTIPADTPYLSAAPDRLAVWEAKLGPKTRSRIGVAWSGSLTHVNDQNRSMALSRLAPLFKHDAAFFSLQQDIRPSDQTWLKAHPVMRHDGEALRDYADTAALVSLMDVVISVDTSIAHLAGALGKPLRVLLPFTNIDWRWHLDRNDSPWYPTAQLFRQPTANNWDDAIAQLERSLAV